jgi:hypothetical protein
MFTSVVEGCTEPGVLWGFDRHQDTIGHRRAVNRGMTGKTDILFERIFSKSLIPQAFPIVSTPAVDNFVGNLIKPRLNA